MLQKTRYSERVFFEEIWVKSRSLNHVLGT